MNRILRLTLAVALFTTFSGVLFAQKENVKGAERLAKGSKPDFAQARSLASQAIANPETQNDPKTWYVAGMVEENYFTQENQKQLENIEPDRANMNKALLDMYDYYVKCYELDNLPNEKGKVSPKYTKKIQKAFEDNLVYYINAIGFFMQEQEYKQALRAVEDFRSIKQMPMFADTPIAQLDSNAMMVNFFGMAIAYQDGQKELAVKYGEEAKNAPYRQNETYQFLAQSLSEIGNTERYVEVMKEGLALFPQESYYSVNLTNYYITAGQNDMAISFLSEAINNDPQNPQLYDVMGKLYEASDVEQSLVWFQKALEVDPNFAESVYNIGRVYFNMAATATEEKTTPETVQLAKDYLAKALPYLQKAYEMNPELAGDLLSRVYYQNGDTAKYEEIQKALGLM